MAEKKKEFTPIEESQDINSKAAEKRATADKREKNEKSGKKKARPISVGVALIIAIIAFAVMGTFLIYMFSEGGSGDISVDTSIEQSFGEETSLEPERSEAEVKETMADANVGDAVIYGKYEQNGNKQDGSEPLEWIVLEKTEDKLLLISRYCIEAKPYNTSNEPAEWEQSTLYKWLNGEFLNSAFTEDERAFIVSEDETAVTMLSAEQAKKYYEYDSWRAAAATEYAKSLQIKEKNGYSLWWLTDKGEIASSACYVYYNGVIYTHGYATSYQNVGVRPVIAVSLEAENEAE